MYAVLSVLSGEHRVFLVWDSKSYSSLYQAQTPVQHDSRGLCHEADSHNGGMHVSETPHNVTSHCKSTSTRLT